MKGKILVTIRLKIIVIIQKVHVRRYSLYTKRRSLHPFLFVKLPLLADSKVFERNNSSSALNSSPCASIVTSSGQEHKHAITRIVNCLLPEMAMCSSSCICSLALKMAIWSSLGQLEISRRSKYEAVIIICCKWRLDNCVEARFKYLSDLNALRGIQQYSFPVTDRSSSSNRFPSGDTS